MESGLTGVSPPENCAISGELVTGIVTNNNSQRYQDIFWLNSLHREREGFKSIYPALKAFGCTVAIQPRLMTEAASPHAISQD